MKFSLAAVLAAVVVSASSVDAFTARPASTLSTASITFSNKVSLQHQRSSVRHSFSTQLNMSSSSQPLVVGIAGATGAVGKEILQCLEKSNGLEVSSLRLFGSSRSAGREVSTKFGGGGGSVTIEEFSQEKARECDVVFLAVSGDFSLEHAKAISEGDNGCVVIDNSSAFRYDKDIPLVVPEINGDITKQGTCKLIANPNCTTAIGLMAIWPLHKAFTLKKIIMSTYQAASGAGQPGMDELTEGTKSWLEQQQKDSSATKNIENKIFAHPLPFNVIPQIDKFQENGYTKEEMKVTWESRKICGLGDDFPVSCSAVRIPTIRAHSEVMIVETEKPVDLEKARQVLNDAPGVKLVDNPDKLEYPMPLTATGQYDVEVGRLRKSLIFGDYGLEFFVCGDQLLRGAALNAVLIAEDMVKNGSLKAKATV